MEKKDEILISVCKLFHKYGIKSVTMDDIAKNIGISKKTLYSFFKDKKDLVKQSINSLKTHHKDSNIIDDFKSKNAIEQLIFIYVTGYKLIDEYNYSYEYDLKKYYPKIYIEYFNTRREKIYNGILNNLKKGISEGFFNDDINVEVISLIHTAKIECMSENSILKDSGIDMKEIFKQMFFYHLRGVSTKKGLDFFKNKIKDLDSYYQLHKNEL